MIFVIVSSKIKARDYSITFQFSLFQIRQKWKVEWLIHFLTEFLRQWNRLKFLLKTVGVRMLNFCWLN